MILLVIAENGFRRAPVHFYTVGTFTISEIVIDGKRDGKLRLPLQFFQDVRCGDSGGFRIGITGLPVIKKLFRTFQFFSLLHGHDHSRPLFLVFFRGKSENGNSVFEMKVRVSAQSQLRTVIGNEPAAAVK